MTENELENATVLNERVTEDNHRIGKDGVLNSPYGYMRVWFPFGPAEWIRFENGYEVKDNKLVDVYVNHRVPDHWITTNEMLKSA